MELAKVLLRATCVVPVVTIIASADGCQAAEALLLTTITAPMFPIAALLAVTFIH